MVLSFLEFAEKVRNRDLRNSRVGEFGEGLPRRSSAEV